MKITREFIQDVFTYDLAQRKPNCYQTFNGEQIRRSLLAHRIIRKDSAHDKAAGFRSVDFSKVAVVSPQRYQIANGHHGHLFTDEGVLAIVTKRVPQIIQLMKEFPGRVYIAGGFLFSVYLHKDITHEGDVDVFICADSPEEAEIILSRGVDLVHEGNSDYPEYFRTEDYRIEVSAMVVTVTSCIKSVSILNSHPIFTKVQFIRRLYLPDRPDMIVGAFDLHPCQMFWSLETGIRCTAAALASLLTRSFPLDLSRRSLSYGNRLRKYINKSCTLLLPGVNVETPIQKFGNNKLPQGKKEIFEQQNGPQQPDLIETRIISRNTKKKEKKPVPPPGAIYYLSGYEDMPYTDYEGDGEEKEEKVEKVRQQYEDDPNEEPRLKRNLGAVMRESINVSLHLGKYSDFCTGNFDLREAIFGREMTFRSALLFKPEAARSKFKHEEEYEKFAMALYIRRDKKAAREIWDKNVEDLLAYLRPGFCGGKPPSFYWKVDNPGAQSFGQNFPRPIAPEEYYGGPEHYVRLRVGLPDFSYWALKVLAARHSIHRDVFRLLCNWSLRAEGLAALERLDLRVDQKSPERAAFDLLPERLASIEKLVPILKKRASALDQDFAVPRSPSPDQNE